jgi:hypothetical protein
MPLRPSPAHQESPPDLDPQQSQGGELVSYLSPGVLAVRVGEVPSDHWVRKRLPAVSGDFCRSVDLRIATVVMEAREPESEVKRRRREEAKARMDVRLEKLERARAAEAAAEVVSEHRRVEAQARLVEMVGDLRTAFNPGRPRDDPTRADDKRLEDRGKQAYLDARRAGGDKYHAIQAAMDATGRRKSWAYEHSASWELELS